MMQLLYPYLTYPPISKTWWTCRIVSWLFTVKFISVLYFQAYQCLFFLVLCLVIVCGEVQQKYHLLIQPLKSNMFWVLDYTGHLLSSKLASFTSYSTLGSLTKTSADCVVSYILAWHRGSSGQRPLFENNGAILFARVKMAKWFTLFEYWRKNETKSTECFWYTSVNRIPLYALLKS